MANLQYYINVYVVHRVVKGGRRKCGGEGRRELGWGRGEWKSKLLVVRREAGAATRY